MAVDSYENSLAHSWSLLKSGTASMRNQYATADYGPSSYTRPDKTVLLPRTDKTIVGSIYNRLALDVASVPIKHVRVDDDGLYKETIKSGLNECLTVEANVDQTSRAFFLDASLSLFDEGVIALVPIVTTVNYERSNSFDILDMRTGKITDWYPKHVKVEIYNDKTGKKEPVILPKEKVAIVENPFYAVMNEPNSTLQRLLRKLALLDAIDEQSGASKLDLIVQLPYTIKSEKRREQANLRRKQIEDQLNGSKYGIAYIDGTEKVVQLNRSVDNNLMTQIEYLTSTLYSQLGLTKEVFEGTADEAVLKNYYSRTIDPILAAFTEEMKRKFLTKTARSQGQSIEYFVDPFKLVPMGDLAELADKLIRNEISSKNEMRRVIGLRASDDPSANELSNPNMPGGGLESDGSIDSLIDEAIAELDEEEAEYEDYE